MARGKWTRWGRGSCEGYSLGLGSLIGFTVVRRDGIRAAPDYFELTSHTRKIDTFPTAKEGMAYAESELESGMKAVLEDWEIYKTEKAKRKS
jgi:hypothetical protein